MTAPNFNKYDLAITYPHTFANYISDGEWKPYPYLEYISKRLTKGIYEGNGRFIINLPPQHGKSLFISKFLPIWYLEKWPKKRIILSTYEASFAAQWGRKVRDEFLNNDKLYTNVRKDVQARNHWETEDSGGMFTAGVGGPITGKSGELIIIDDPVKNWDEARSPTYQERNRFWFDSTLYTRRQPGTTIVLLMTRWHEADMSGYLENEQDDDWEVIKFPALCELEGKSDEINRSYNDALCPDRFTTEDLEKTKRAVGPQVWSGLYQQRPTALEGGIIKRDWIKYHNEDINEAMSTVPHYDQLIQSWDLTFKKTENGSFVVGQIWGKKGANFYLLHQIRKRMDFPETRDAILQMSNAFPLCMTKLVEDKANGPAIISELSSKIPGLVPVKVDFSKESRLFSVSGLFQAGNVYIPDPKSALWVNDFVEELCNFPNAANDDQADACAQALHHLNAFQMEYEPLEANGVSTLYDNQLF